MIYCYTGDGKGKTTAALGASVRALGYGWKTCIVQFMKGTWTTGEVAGIEKIDGIDLFRAGKGFYKILDDRFTDEEHRAAVTAGLELVREKIKNGAYNLIILDEINTVLSLKLADTRTVIELLKSAPPTLHFILTGRDAPPEIIELADLVTEMKAIKHPYEKGVKAVQGLDF